MNRLTDHVELVKCRHMMIFVILAAIFSLFIGCGSIPKVSQKVIDEFKPEVIPEEEGIQEKSNNRSHWDDFRRL
ncbi:MAG: hypothetical protein DRI57_26170 [Deltaproteobacteria bacterium]|nr:MAG: hypothetical protein DRI57_26170 [Deltaproteobacteria bacterium]